MGFISPPLAKGKVLRVREYGVLDVMLHVGWGVSVNRRVMVEGLYRSNVPQRLEREAIHACVVLLGGKRVVVQEGPLEKDGQQLARVYLDERMYREPPGVISPVWYTGELLDVTVFLDYIREHEFSVDRVLQHLNKRG